MALGNNPSEHFRTRIKQLTQVSKRDPFGRWIFISFNDFDNIEDIGNGVFRSKLKEEIAILYDNESDSSRIYRLGMIGDYIYRASDGVLSIIPSRMADKI